MRRRRRRLWWRAAMSKHKRQVTLEFGVAKAGGSGRGDEKTECFERGGIFGSAFQLFSRSTKEGKELPDGDWRCVLHHAAEQKDIPRSGRAKVRSRSRATWS